MATKRTKTEGRIANASTTPKPAPKRKIARRTPGSGKRPGNAGTQGASQAEITTELIALRAYFIAEKREQAGIPGDSLSDWLEAERQLVAERK